MRRLYTFLLTIILPFIFIRFLWKGIKQPLYQKRWKERLGIVPFTKLSQSIWLHAVSLGEVNAALPLIKALRLQYPNLSLMVTTGTPSGSMQVLKQTGIKNHSYIPIDLPCFINRFLKHIRPKLCILMETELWPNLIFYCQQKHIPVLIANARLSSQSLKGYTKIKKWLKPVWSGIEMIGTQTQLDLDRFLQIGVPLNKLKVLGNLKFEMTIPKDIDISALKLRQNIGESRPVLVAASTHEGEEEIILKAFHLILKQYPNLLLVLVPRHLSRFDSVANLIKQKNLPFVRYTEMHSEKISPGVQVLLIDVFGELLPFYAISDLALVGGSLAHSGGHNLLEPAAFSKPVLSGAGLSNFLIIRDLFIEKNALDIVNTPEDIASVVISYLKNPTKIQERGKLTNAIFRENQGALQRHLDIIKRYIKLDEKISAA